MSAIITKRHAVTAITHEHPWAELDIQKLSWVGSEEIATPEPIFSPPEHEILAIKLYFKA